jgi:hypothetical protein
MMEQIEDAGARCRSLMEAMDTPTPTGRMLMPMVGRCAAFECAMMRKRPQAGHTAARAHGQAAPAVEAVRGSPFNMCGEVSTPNLYAVSHRNCRQALETKIMVMCRRLSRSSSNDDVESPGGQGTG